MFGQPIRIIAIIAVTIAACAAETVWQENGGVLIMEAERGTPVDPSDAWVVATDYDDYRGDGFLRWEGGDKYNSNGHGRMHYTFVIDTPGTYHFRMRAQAKGPDFGLRRDEGNDCWVQRSVGSSGYYKFYIAGQSTADWHFDMKWEQNHNGVRASYELDAGEHTFTIAARSEYFMVDRLYFVQDTSDFDQSLSESPSTDGGSGFIGTSGEVRVHHRIGLDFLGPELSEDGTPNPFTDYRFDLVFAKDGRELIVPGFFAADGGAADSGAGTGAVWRAWFTPDEAGTWQWTARLRSGPGVAAIGYHEDPTAGEPAAFDGATGTLEVAASDKPADDFRAKGVLRYVGERYLRFANGDYFLKAGAGDPENLLSYTGFDNTPAARHSFAPHRDDWADGDAAWQGGQGKEIVGMLNHLVAAGANSIYFMLHGTDDEAVFPWLTMTGDYTRYDVSKLAQWDRVFAHAQRVGVHLHVFFNEHENDRRLDDGELGTTRRIYYREMIARFGAHQAISWNLGEELIRGGKGDGDPTHAQILAWADWVDAIDPYGHVVGAHNYSDNDLYDPLLGAEDFDAATLQNTGSLANSHDLVRTWIDAAAAAGRPWAVSLDEQGGASVGLEPTVARMDEYRKQALWGTLTAGGAGVEYYFGYKGDYGTLAIEDMSVYDQAWAQCGHARAFFAQHVPFWQTAAHDELVDRGWCLADPGAVYVIYLAEGGSVDLDLSGAPGDFGVWWFDPRSGGALQTGSVTSVAGGALRNLGQAPGDTSSDWVVLVRTLGGGANQAPQVDAGADATVMGTDFALAGSVTDDGLPTTGSLSWQWTQVDGPATAAFDDATSLTPTVSVGQSGSWVFRLSADDGELTAFDEVTITTVADDGSIRINFQPGAAAVPAGYRPDDGSAYATHDGLAYGWSQDMTGEARDRDVAADQRYDTLVHIKSATWELALADGSYQITLACGDAGYTDQVNHITVEGTRLADADGQDHFDDYSATVSVSDGRLSISAASDADNPKLLYLVVTPASASTRRIAVAATDAAGSPVVIDGVISPADATAATEGDGISFDGLDPAVSYRIELVAVPSGNL